jgi:RNA polymerase sigma-70 factor (ECF subfamily)
MLDDRAAVEQARLGDERAWRRLYECHSDLIFRLAMRTVGDREAALDIVQETYVKASRALDGFRGDASFRSWLASIALNEARTWVRRTLRKREVSIESIAEPAQTGASADVVVARADLAERALEFIRTLPDQQRDAVLLRTTEGLPYREIAEALGTSEGSVRVSYHHGMAKLREHMMALLEADERRPADSSRAPPGTDAAREGRSHETASGHEAAPGV